MKSNLEYKNELIALLQKSIKESKKSKQKDKLNEQLLLAKNLDIDSEIFALEKSKILVNYSKIIRNEL